MRLRLSITICFCSIFSSSGFAIAQQNQPELKSNTTVVRRQKSPPLKSRSTGDEINNLKAPPEMPGISFPNAKFLYGFSSEVKGGRSMGARFEVPDQSAAVISYYKQSLPNTGWKVFPSDKPDTLSAQSAQYKSSVTITTFKSAKPGCEVLFGYAVKY